MLPFRSYLSKLGIRLDCIRVFQKRTIFSPFSFRYYISTVIKKKKKYTYRLKIHFLRKKKKNTFKDYADTENKFTSRITNEKLGFYFPQIEFFEGCTHDTINWFSTRAKLHRNESIDWTIPRTASFLQLVKLFRIERDSATTIFTLDTERTNELGRVLES